MLKSKRNEVLVAAVLVAPFVIIYGWLFVYPTIQMVQLSFTNAPLIGPGSWVGLKNYQRLFADKVFGAAVWNTSYFVLLTVIPGTAVALTIALMVSRLKGWLQSVILSAFFLPFILPSASIGLIWVFIFTPETGLFAEMQAWLGRTPVAVLADPNLAMWGIAVATIWWTLGFNFVLYLAGLQDIPRELYEAAAIDGASSWQQIRHITIPMLNRTTTLVVLLQIIASLKIFDQVFLMTQGGPGISTQVVLGLVTNTAFTDYRVGAASAASVLLFILIVIIALIRQLFDRRQERTA